jgi:hypothetical protein
VYHLELRRFPRQAWSFNLTEQDLRAVVEPFARGEVVEVGDQKWNPHVAKLRILEGPRLPVQQLSMGRGWRNAERQGEDVTERVLAAAKALDGSSTVAPAEPPAGAPSSELDVQVDSLGLGILSLLDPPAPLWRAWRLAQARFPERSASEALVAAELAVRSLLDKRLIALTQAATDAPDGANEGREATLEVPEERLEPLLRAVESWAATGESDVRMRRR